MSDYDWNRLGTPAPDTRIWWCAEREAFVPGAGHPHWTMPAYCYWTGTVDHNDRCGWVAVEAVRVTGENPQP